jgi:hypothetical protein
MNPAVSNWDKVSPKRARSAARAYAALGARSPTQRWSAAASAAYTLTVASLAGLVIRRGQITALAGAERDYTRLARIRLLVVAVTGIGLLVLVNVTVPAAYRFWVFVAVEVILLGLMAAILPSRRFHRARGLLPNFRAWKKTHGAKETWVLFALIHDPATTADDLEEAMRSLIPVVSAGCAAIVLTTTEVQVQALRRLGFGRDSEDSGLIYLMGGQAPESASSLPASSDSPA